METQITARVKTFEDACKVLGIDPVKSLPYENPTEDEDKATNAFKKLILIAKALNEGWKPDWGDSSQWKYYPWWDMRPEYGSGLGLSFDDYGYASSTSTVGSRLCFKSSALSDYFAKQFIELYSDMIVIKG